MYSMLQNRAYGAQTAPSAACLSTSNLKATILPNKLAVTAVENNSPISRVSVFYRLATLFNYVINCKINYIYVIILTCTYIAKIICVERKKRERCWLI